MSSLRLFAIPLLLATVAATSTDSSTPPAARGPRAPRATLESADPFRLFAGPGAPQRITVRGTNFENAGHQNRDQYMHWQIRRDGGAWERCGRAVLNPAAHCRTTGWSHNAEVLEIGGAHTIQPGVVELRVFSGLADETATDPSQAPNGAEWSNVLRIPVVVPAIAPAITDLSPTTFPLGAGAAASRLAVSATSVDPTAVVVFRGDVVVTPESMSGGALHVTVPEVYRRTTPGELSLTVRTDRGGHSAPRYIRFAEMSAPVSGIAITKSPTAGVDVGAPSNPGNVAPGVARGAVKAGVRRSDACAAGFVWREATPQDRACVPPEGRARAARQNAEAANRRVADAPPNAPAPCRAGFVWREAVAGDAVCVTPAERAEAAEENRLAPSRLAP